MSTFELTAAMQTGIEEIDNQHRQLLSWANSFADDHADANAQKVTETLNNLQDYVSYHFQTEEEAMDRYDYGELEKHRKQHHRLINEVSDLFSRTRGKETSKGALAEVEYLLTDWIQLHIKEWDQPFAAFLKSRSS
jgi:hemerythrin